MHTGTTPELAPRHTLPQAWQLFNVSMCSCKRRSSSFADNLMILSGRRTQRGIYLRRRLRLYGLVATRLTNCRGTIYSQVRQVPRRRQSARVPRILAHPSTSLAPSHSLTSLLKDVVLVPHYLTRTRSRVKRRQTRKRAVHMPRNRELEDSSAGSEDEECKSQ
ncbi:hypothetical protein BDN67DRAFT_502921 [Paxillus ammoniavirescens]|nr:hypothetical protein BDN67DRAFT_502921 [Paxillus ammoniavirescens]